MSSQQNNNNNISRKQRLDRDYGCWHWLGPILVMDICLFKILANLTLIMGTFSHTNNEHIINFYIATSIFETLTIINWLALTINWFAWLHNENCNDVQFIQGKIPCLWITSSIFTGIYMALSFCVFVIMANENFIIANNNYLLLMMYTSSIWGGLFVLVVATVFVCFGIVFALQCIYFVFCKFSSNSNSNLNNNNNSNNATNRQQLIV